MLRSTALIFTVSCALGAPLAANANDTRLFVHVEGPERNVSLPLEWADAAMLTALGVCADAQAALHDKAEGLRNEPVGSRSEWTVCEMELALEQRPDTRMAAADVQAVLEPRVPALP